MTSIDRPRTVYDSPLLNGIEADTRERLLRHEIAMLKRRIKELEDELREERRKSWERRYG